MLSAGVRDRSSTGVAEWATPRTTTPIAETIVTRPFAWTELHSTDPTASTEFYGSLLGWSFETTPTPVGDYHSTTPSRPPGAGVRGSDGFAGWLLYVDVDDLAASVWRAVELGGTVEQDITEIPEGRFAVLRDPQGQRFGLSEKLG